MLDKIRQLCTQRNMSITKLEEIMGFGNSTISKWKNSSPSVDKLKKVADYFGVTVDSLIDEHEK